MKIVYKIMEYKKSSLLVVMAMMLCTSFLQAQCTFTVSTSNENTGFTQVLILSDASGVIVSVFTGNSTSFTTPANGSYNVQALNYDPNDPPVPFPMVGDMISMVGTTSGCFNDNLVGDVKPIECQCDLGTYTASYNPMPGFGVTYVLADGSGLILAMNDTGTFNTADGLTTNTFIHALHYDLNNPPTPLPMVGGNIADVGTADIGCFNDEFTTNPLCILQSDNCTDCDADHGVITLKSIPRPGN